MGLILCLSGENESNASLIRIVKIAVPNHAIEILFSIGELSERLRKSLADISVAVLYAAERSELLEMIYLGELLGEIRVVLVLPDAQPESLNKAHILHPRFIATSRGDFKYLGSVLKKMMFLYDNAHGVQKIFE